MLAEHDVGLALMYTPHPSLAPMEMAVGRDADRDQHFENKNAEAMAAISSNLITVEPTVEGVASGLRAAAASVDDVGRRLRGSDVHWSRDWDQSLGDALLSRLADFLNASMRSRALSEADS